MSDEPPPRKIIPIEEGLERRRPDPRDRDRVGDAGDVDDLEDLDDLDGIDAFEDAGEFDAESLDVTPEPPPASLWERVGDVHPGFTYAIILLILIGFAAELVTATARVGDIFAGGSLMGPLLETGACALAPFRAGEWWRTLSCVFLHANLLHVGSNLIALAILGGVAERAFGHARFLLLFVLAAAFGSAATFVNQSTLGMAKGSLGSIGASGAVFGVGAAVVVAAFRLRGLLPAWRVRALVGATLPLLLSSLVAGFARPGTDNAAHLGGALGGLLLGFVLPFDARLSLRVMTPSARLLWAGLGLLALGLLVASGALAIRAAMVASGA
ncbi:MAG: rhomboid family intramembrane serine protease [Candidatus Eiseniibacteriota bacterium]